MSCAPGDSAEVDKLADTCAPVGIDAAFIAEGHRVLRALDQDNDETVDAIAHREQTTAKVREAEQALIDLIRELRAAREIARLATGETLLGFSLAILRAHVGRRAARGATGTDEGDAFDDDDLDDDDDLGGDDTPDVA